MKPTKTEAISASPTCLQAPRGSSAANTIPIVLPHLDVSPAKLQKWEPWVADWLIGRGC